MFSQMSHSLQGFAILSSAVYISGSDVSCQDTLGGAGLEILLHLRGNLKFPRVSEVKQSLPCFYHLSVNMRHPDQALSDVDTKVLETVHLSMRIC